MGISIFNCNMHTETSVYMLNTHSTSKFTMNSTLNQLGTLTTKQQDCLIIQTILYPFVTRDI